MAENQPEPLPLVEGKEGLPIKGILFIEVKSDKFIRFCFTAGDRKLISQNESHPDWIVGTVPYSQDLKRLIISTMDCLGYQTAIKKHEHTFITFSLKPINST